MNIYWEAKKYAEEFSFVPKYGEDILGLISLPEGLENERKPLAIDLGCGTGALTKKLSDMGFDTLGIDSSKEMLCAARAKYPSLKFAEGDAVDFCLSEKADVIFSNAVFHWIDSSKQGALAKNLFEQLKSGGQLVCEFGGKGCAETVHKTLEEIFKSRGLCYGRTFYFPTVGEYSSVLEQAGFRVEAAFLFDRPTPQKGDDGLKSWIKMFIKSPFDGLVKGEREDILNQAEERLRPLICRDGVWYIDYVRIRVKAIKPKN